MDSAISPATEPTSSNMDNWEGLPAFSRIVYSRGLTLRYVSIQTGISYPTIMKIKNGGKVRYAIIKLIADFLHVKPEELQPQPKTKPI